MEKRFHVSHLSNIYITKRGQIDYVICQKEYLVSSIVINPSILVIVLFISQEKMDSIDLHYLAKEKGTLKIKERFT